MSCDDLLDGPNSLENLIKRGVLNHSSGDDNRYLHTPDVGLKTFDVVVEASLVAPLADELARYKTYLAEQGYAVTIKPFSGTAEELRGYLQERYADAGLQGALFVGDLPYVKFNGTPNTGDDRAVVHDLYFMDLDGHYEFRPGTDVHTGDVGPEIYMSRLVASNLQPITNGDEVSLLREYFEKDFAARDGLITYEDRANWYADDDWRGYVFDSSTLPLTYADVTQIRDINWTDKDMFVSFLRENVGTAVEQTHAAATYHQIFTEDAIYPTLDSREVADLGVGAAFMNLWSCSAADYTAANNLIGAYLFGHTNKVLNAIGSTTPGSMLNMSRFYEFVGLGMSIGEAYRAWFEENAGSTDDPNAQWKLDWHDGMAMEGDPTLVPALMFQPARTTGDDGSNTLNGTLGADLFNGFDGNDIIIVGSGRDTAEGGAGADLISEVVSPANGIDVLRGGLGNDTLITTGGTDSLYGEEGDDLLAGNRFAGHGVFDGGAGNDTISVLAGQDTVLGGEGNDTITAAQTLSWLYGQDGDDLISGECTKMFGGAGNDTLHGGNSAQRLDGEMGNDLLEGMDGADTLSGGDGADTLKSGTGDDVARAGTGNDSLLGQDGADRLFGETGADTLTGGLGADTLDGGSENDLLQDGSGSDDDLFYARAGDDRVIAAGGNDTVFGDTGADLIDGGADDDRLSGGADADTLRGGAGNDLLTGEAGNDDLRGGSGNDTMIGGTGLDIFRFGASDTGADIIRYFEVGIDLLDLRGAGLSGDKNVLAAAEDTAAGALITASSLTVLLEGVSVARLAGVDFAL